MPDGVIEKYQAKVEIVTSGEKEFVFSCQNTYDLIMSDGDHQQADQWFEHVFDKLVNPGGVLIYHDINLVDANAFQNLIEIYNRVKAHGLSHYLFNKNSRNDERCQRGLLVIFKNF
jgi:predicted O-methyltransferase YrrM